MLHELLNRLEACLTDLVTMTSLYMKQSITMVRTVLVNIILSKT